MGKDMESPEMPALGPRRVARAVGRVGVRMVRRGAAFLMPKDSTQSGFSIKEIKTQRSSFLLGMFLVVQAQRVFLKVAKKPA
nr:hypothetical protein [uncultured Achromobacter sp.]